MIEDQTQAILASDYFSDSTIRHQPAALPWAIIVSQPPPPAAFNLPMTSRLFLT